MAQSPYPFPRRDEAVRTLERDHVYAKIPAGDIPALVDEAWRVGERAARDFLARTEGAEQLDFARIMRENGLAVTVRDEDFVSGGIRYFADYQPLRCRVTVYGRSVAKWAEANGLSYRQAENVILMHEYFHYLEYTELGPTSRLRLVPMLRLGGLTLGRTGIPSLGEIAADAFAGVLYQRASRVGALAEDAVLESGRQDVPSPDSAVRREPEAGGGGWSAMAAAILAALIAVYCFHGWFALPGTLELRFATDGDAWRVAKNLYLFILALLAGSLALLSRRAEGRMAALTTLCLLAIIHWSVLADNLRAGG